MPLPKLLSCAGHVQPIRHASLLPGVALVVFTMLSDLHLGIAVTALDIKVWLAPYLCFALGADVFNLVLLGVFCALEIRQGLPGHKIAFCQKRIARLLKGAIRDNLMGDFATVATPYESCSLL